MGEIFLSRDTLRKVVRAISHSPTPKGEGTARLNLRTGPRVGPEERMQIHKCGETAGGLHSWGQLRRAYKWIAASLRFAGLPLFSRSRRARENGEPFVRPFENGSRTDPLPDNAL